MEIVGLAADAVYFSVREEIHPAVYVPLGARTGATLLVRTAEGREDIRRMLGREVTRIRPGLSVREVTPFHAIVTQQMIRERLLAALSAFLAMLALLLAVLGIYGVLTYGVARERREIAMRMALGARPAHVLTLLTRRLFVVIGAGSVAGIAGGIAFGRTVRTLLFDMQPTDPVALLAPVAALAAAAAIASIPPALRAIRIDPAQVINSET
jgi:predicted lysophospholipase L1 biosynthesis ABC-type transport system permease subunit